MARATHITVAVLAAILVWATAGASPSRTRDETAAAPVAPLSPEEQALFLQRQTDGSAIGLVITNYGFFGNNFVTRSPSMEYPLGSQIDHLIRAGFWVGAINADGDTVVSSGSVSGTWGGGSSTLTEYTPKTNIKERSTLITSRAFSKKAVSEQDFITSYTDYPKRGTNKAVLDVTVGQTTYLWSYKFAEAFVIASFTVKNDGGGDLFDTRLGIFSELASGWKGAYDTWPPPGTSWFKKKALEYFPDERMVGEHHYTYQNGAAPSWGGIAILGAKDKDNALLALRTSFNVWDWYEERDSSAKFTDPYRFTLMGNGDMDHTEDIVPERDDPVELLSAGPFPVLVPGDSMVFVCAFLGGMDREALIQNAKWAQRAFDNAYILPSPPQIPRIKVVPQSNAINVYWDNYPEDKLDPFYKIPDFEGYRIYITRKEGATSKDFDMVGQWDLVDGLGYDTGFDSVRETNVFDSTTYNYHYTITDVKDGFKYWVSLTAYDKGMPEQGVESMESGVLGPKVLTVPGPLPQENSTVLVFPNPYKGQAVWDGSRDREKYIWFVNLPKRATIRIFTLGGDLVKTIDFDASTYTGADVQGLKTSTERFVAMPGGICAWDLITDHDQATATGLYIFSVEDKETGKNQIGKFMIIK